MEEDEFGGFEAAELEEETEALPQAQASPNPWAFFPGQNQPDLIRPPGQAATTPEIRPNPHDPLEPNFPQAAGTGHSSLFTEGATGGGSTAEGAAAGNGGNWEADFKQYEPSTSDSRSLSEQVLEPHFGAIKSDRPVPDGVLDLDLTQRQSNRPADELDLELEPDLQNLEPANQNAVAPLEVEAVNQSDALRQNVAAAAANEGAGDMGGEFAAQPEGSAGNEATVQQLQLVAAEKSALQKEIAELIKNNQVLEKENESLQAELSRQREQYTTVQERHCQDLEEMRRAGQDALALIVEEYKELCKTCVLEQQVSCQEQLQTAVQGEQAKWKELLKTQQEEFDNQLEKQRQKLTQEIQESLEQEKQRHQEELCKLVQEETVKLETQLQTQVKTVQEENEDLVQEKFKKERVKWKESLVEEQSKLQSFMDQQRDQSVDSLATAVREESNKCQERLSEAISQEHEQGKKALQEANEAAQEQLKQAVRQQKQRDTVVKKKSLASVDLFLEGARQQLRLLMETDPLDTGDNNVKGDSDSHKEGAQGVSNGES